MHTSDSNGRGTANMTWNLCWSIPLRGACGGVVPVSFSVISLMLRPAGWQTVSLGRLLLVASGIPLLLTLAVLLCLLLMVASVLLLLLAAILLLGIAAVLLLLVAAAEPSSPHASGGPIVAPAHAHTPLLVHLLCHGVDAVWSIGHDLLYELHRHGHALWIASDVHMTGLHTLLNLYACATCVLYHLDGLPSAPNDLPHERLRHFQHLRARLAARHCRHATSAHAEGHQPAAHAHSLRHH
mmetsp:Transcript_851/g.1478  ORF Transcript_851/g.1478 Transcript_851/m.1478 type:complete len:240 (+) Transcript_851:462-1181(+)